MSLSILLALPFATAAVLLGWRVRRLERMLGTVRTDLARREAALREHAAASERERIFNDLHDDLGARLLGMIHEAATPAEADRARAALQDLRDVVTRSRGTPGTLLDVLADIHGEVAQRLAAVGMELDWEAAPDLPDPALDTARALHLHRIVREAVSNAIRHAEARRLRVRLRRHGERLCLDLTDDGSGEALAAVGRGAGTRGMQDRARELAGEIRWAPGTERGTKVVLEFPLPADGTTAAA